MSELRDAIATFDARDEAINHDNDQDTYRLLFIGMDLNVDELLDYSQEYAGSAIVAIGEQMGGDGEALELLIHGPNGSVSIRLYLQGAWMDGFSAAAMLFMRRREGR